MEENDRNKKNKTNKFKTTKSSNTSKKFFTSSQINKNIFATPSEKRIKNIFIRKKKYFFKVEDLSKKHNENSKDGRWDKEEHNKFLEGIVKYGINWRKIKSLINTRTSVQIRSHAQKFFQKMKTCKDEKLGIDFTLDSVSNLKDMINQIKTVNGLYNIKNVFSYLSNEYDIKRYRKSTFFPINNNLTSLFENDGNNNFLNLHEDNNDKNNNDKNNKEVIEDIPQIIDKELKINYNINNNIIAFNNNILINKLIQIYLNLINNINLKWQLNSIYINNLLQNNNLLNNNSNLSQNNNSPNKQELSKDESKVHNNNPPNNHNLLANDINNNSFINFLALLNNIQSQNPFLNNFNINNPFIINNQFNNPNTIGINTPNIDMNSNNKSEMKKNEK